MDPPAGDAPAGAGAGAGAAAQPPLPGAQQQQMGPAQVADVLRNQERIRKSTDLPPFYASSKDVCTAELFIQRFEVAAEIAGWIRPVGQPNRYANTCREFYMLLRGNALQWWASLENCIDFDKTDWPAVRARFLESYAKQYTPTTACTGLTEMKQKTGESVQDYFVRCNVIYDRIKEITPPGLDAWRGVVPAGMGDDALVAGKRQGVKEMGLFFLHLLFVVGLREDIRLKTIEAADQTLEEARVTAKAKELLLNDKRKVHQVFGVKDQPSSDEEEEDAYLLDPLIDLNPEEEEQLQQINAIRRQQGKRPFRIKKRINFGEIICHYCNKKGHFQKICRKRIKDKAPIVFKKANGIRDNSESEDEEEIHTNSISVNKYYGINSLTMEEQSDSEQDSDEFWGPNNTSESEEESENDLHKISAITTASKNGLRVPSMHQKAQGTKLLLSSLPYEHSPEVSQQSSLQPEDPMSKQE